MTPAADSRRGSGIHEGTSRSLWGGGAGGASRSRAPWTPQNPALPRQPRDPRCETLGFRKPRDGGASGRGRPRLGVRRCPSCAAATHAQRGRPPRSPRAVSDRGRRGSGEPRGHRSLRVDAYVQRDEIQLREANTQREHTRAALLRCAAGTYWIPSTDVTIKQTNREGDGHLRLSLTPTSPAADTGPAGFCCWGRT